MPLGSDDLPVRKAPREQRRAQERAEGKKRMRGKQPGAPGAAMRWEDPDRTENHYPEGACGCGRDLADAADLGVARSYQQDEIPAAPAERVQHDLHETRCACGREHVAPRPPGVPDAPCFAGWLSHVLGPGGHVARAEGSPGGELPECDGGAVKRGVVPVRRGRGHPLDFAGYCGPQVGAEPPCQQGHVHGLLRGQRGGAQPIG